MEVHPRKQEHGKFPSKNGNDEDKKDDNSTPKEKSQRAERSHQRYEKRAV